MSKLATILHPRTLPTQPNVLFSECSPATPDMFKVVVKSWQNSGIHPVVNVEPLTESLQAIDQEQAQAVEDASACKQAHAEEVDFPFASRLADEWQVGIETLVPLTWQSIPPMRTFPRPTEVDSTSHDRAIAELESGVSSLERATSFAAHSLTNPSSYLSDKLVQAVQGGMTSTVQQVLQLLTKQEQSHIVSAMMVAREIFVKDAATPTTLDWETGTDSNGRPFMRLNVSIKNDLSKGSGATKLTIGSDGTSYAIFTERWNSAPMYLDAEDALNKLNGNGQKRVRDLQNVMSLPSKKFKAAGF